MAYEYDDAPHEGRILWGRIAVYGVAFLLVFVVGSWVGGRGGEVSQADYDELSDQVQELASENALLQQQLAAASAGQEPPASGEAEPTGDDAGEQPAEGDAPQQGGDGGDGGGMRTYVVEQGDNLYEIARQMYGDGDQWRLIAEENGLDSSNPLTVGQELRIPPAN